MFLKKESDRDIGLPIKIPTAADGPIKSFRWLGHTHNDDFDGFSLPGETKYCRGGLLWGKPEDFY